MIKKNFDKLLLLIIFVLTSNNLAFSKINTKILYKINDHIITNLDIENEKKFLLFLNPNLSNLSNEQIFNISKDSLTNRKIKEIELEKYFDLKKENFGDEYINNFILNSNYKSKDYLLNQLKEFNLEYEYFKKNVIVDNLWREFIFNKFKNQIKIDSEKLKKQLNKQNKEIEELNLSEILFDIKLNMTFEELSSKIFEEIEKSGFEAAASIYSISDSKNFGGSLGWIKSNQISEKIYSEIKKVENITMPIKTNNGYLIIKINEKRKIVEELNIEKELQKLINIESGKELNKLGYIYFNKIKKRIFINEQ